MNIEESVDALIKKLEGKGKKIKILDKDDDVNEREEDERGDFEEYN